jgi:hypothetical protein
MAMADGRATSNRVQCARCGGIYDLGGVETVARYADCTVFKAPCCGATVDDRRWKSLPDITYLRDVPGAPFEYEDARAWRQFEKELRRV